jgi:hypothetical protein
MWKIKSKYCSGTGILIECKRAMKEGTSKDVTACEINTQPETIISSKIQTNLHRLEKQYNKGILKKPMI